MTYTQPASSILRFQDVIGRVVSTNSAGIGTSAAGYTTIRQAASVSLHFIPYDTTDLQLAYGNCLKSSTPPAEAAFNAIEIAASISVVTSKVSLTLKSAVMPVFFGGSRLQVLPSQSYVESDRVPLFIPGGSWIMVQTYSNRLASTGSVVLGETGKLIATSANWPQQTFVGGSLNTAFLGSQTNTTDTFSTAIPAVIDTGSTTINTGHGFWPAAIIGRPLSDSNIRPVAIVGDSLCTRGNNDQARSDEEFSGKGYVERALGHSIPYFNAASGGAAIQTHVGNNTYAWKLRAALIKKCDVAYLCMGNNDAAVGRSSANIIADLTTMCGYLRSLGIRKIVGGTITCRYTTTDGGQTNGGWVEYGGAGTNTTIDAVNAAIVAGQIPLDDYIENRTAIQQGLGGSYPKLSTVYASTTSAAGSTTSAINFGSTVAGDTRGKCMLIGTESRLIGNNTTTSATVYVNNFTGAPANGTAVTILNQYMDDGVHYTNLGHAAAAANFQTSKLLI